MKKTQSKKPIEMKFEGFARLHKALTGAQLLCRYKQGSKEYQDKILNQFLTEELIDVMKSEGLLIDFDKKAFSEDPDKVLNNLRKNVDAFKLHKAEKLFKDKNVKPSKLFKALQQSREKLASRCTSFLNGIECVEILQSMKSMDDDDLLKTSKTKRFKELLIPAISKCEWHPTLEQAPKNLYSFINTPVIIKNFKKAKFNINTLLSACSKNMEACYKEKGLCDESEVTLDKNLKLFITESRQCVQSILDEMIFQKAVFDLSADPTKDFGSYFAMLLSLGAKKSAKADILKNTKILGLICTENPLFPNQLDDLLEKLAENKKLRENQRFIVAVLANFPPTKKDVLLLNPYGYPTPGKAHGVFLDIQFDEKGDIIIFLDDFFGIMLDENEYHLNAHNHRHLILSTVAKHFPSAECFMQCFVLNGQAIQSDRISCLTMVQDAVGVACKNAYHTELVSHAKKQSDIPIVPLNNDVQEERFKIHMLRAKHLPEKLFILYRPIQSTTRLKLLPAEALEYVYKNMSLEETVESHLDKEFGFNTYIYKRAIKISDRTFEWVKENDINAKDFSDMRNELCGSDLESELEHKKDSTEEKHYNM